MTARALKTGRLLIVAAMVLSLSGCVEMRVDEIPEWVPSWMIPEEATSQVTTDDVSPNASAPENSTDSYGRDLPVGTHGHGTEVLMLGRSVMYGWFDHWNWGEQNGVLRDGFALYYGELDSPPDIGGSAIDYIRAVPDTTVVCFKMCFVDFWATSAEEADLNLEENLAHVDAVVDAATDHGTPLVLFTALPETAGNTTPWTIDVHRRYGDALQEIARTHEDVYVFDIHDVLTDQTGSLYRGFAAAVDDAHLNDVAYMELDESFFAFMEREITTP